MAGQQLSFHTQLFGLCDGGIARARCVSRLLACRETYCALPSWGASGYDPVPLSDEDEVEAVSADATAEYSVEIEDSAATLKTRTAVLNHAYGFVSRDNRAGGLDHIYLCIADDPNPDKAWAWFFEKMLAWEVKDAALVFAQQYIRRMSYREDHVAVVKIMMRCRLVNESFLPLPEDRPQALLAAQQCDNEELAKSLR